MDAIGVRRRPKCNHLITLGYIYIQGYIYICILSEIFKVIHTLNTVVSFKMPICINCSLFVFPSTIKLVPCDTEVDVCKVLGHFTPGQFPQALSPPGTSPYGHFHP